jgi:short-subunit dehydrogenase
MSQRRPVTLITGASAGIGWALARVFAANGHELFLVARREQRLAALASDIVSAGHPRPSYVVADLERHDAVAQIAGAMTNAGVEPEIVVNNAGFGLLGEAATLGQDEQIAMIDVNVRALTALSLAFLDSLERQRGGILNVASVAAFLPGPYMAAYYASKAYVLSFSEALHWELKPRGIRVTTLCPGPVPTEFQLRAGFVPESGADMLGQSAQAVAQAGYRGLRRGRRVVVPGLGNKVVTAAMRLIPRGLLLASVGRYNSRRRPQR